MKDLCTKCQNEPRRSPTQRWGKLCHAAAMVESRQRAQNDLDALLDAAGVPRGAPRVERFRFLIGRKISATKLARNAERRNQVAV